MYYRRSMDIIITGAQARRVQRIARQKNPAIKLVRNAPLVESRETCTHEVIEQSVRPTLEALGIIAEGEVIHLRVFNRGAKAGGLGIHLHYSIASPPPQSFDLVVATDASANYAFHKSGIRVFVDGPSLCVLDIIKEHLEATEPQTIARRIIPFARGLALASEFCGQFSRDPFAPDGKDATYDVEPVLSIEALRSFAERVQRSRGIRVLRDVLQYLSENHGSPMEVMVYALAVVRPEMGGLRLPKPETNRPLKLSKKELELISHVQLTPDLFWKAYNEAGEYDGAIHDTPEAIKEDKRRIVDYQTLGITVFPATSANFRTTEAADEYMRALARHMERCEGRALKRRMDRLFADPAHRERRILLRKAVLRCR